MKIELSHIYFIRCIDESHCCCSLLCSRLDRASLLSCWRGIALFTNHDSLRYHSSVYTIYQHLRYTANDTKSFCWQSRSRHSSPMWKSLQLAVLFLAWRVVMTTLPFLQKESWSPRGQGGRFIQDQKLHRPDAFQNTRLFSVFSTCKIISSFNHMSPSNAILGNVV